MHDNQSSLIDFNIDIIHEVEEIVKYYLCGGLFDIIKNLINFF